MAAEADFERLADQARRRADRAVAAMDNPLHDAWDAQVLQLVEEVGEFVYEYKATTGRKPHTGNWAAVKTELADIYICLNVLAKLLDIDLDDCVASKMVEIQRRGGL